MNLKQKCKEVPDYRSRSVFGSLRTPLKPVNHVLGACPGMKSLAFPILFILLQLLTNVWTKVKLVILSL